jgi:hypothetical protein
MKRILMVAATLLGCVHPGAREPGAGGAAAVLLEFKAASGGARWDEVAGLETQGTLLAGGLSGPIKSLQDVRTGRSVSRYTLGPTSGAEGFDGSVSWQQDPGGEVTALDAPEAREVARTDAWLAALGYWYAQRAPAALGPVSEREEGGARYRVLEATPPQGRTVALWFDARSGLLARTVQRREADTVTSVLDDYREVSGVLLPFHLVTDRTDAAGRTDPRQRIEMRVERIVVR